MALRVGINGFGRIGRLVFRVMAERPSDFDVVAINDLSDPKHLALLLKYDSVQGRFKGTVDSAREEHRGQRQGDPDHHGEGPGRVCPGRSWAARSPWNRPGDSPIAPAFRNTSTPAPSAWSLSAPAKDDLDATIVLGVNDQILNKNHRIISNASCTTNCLAPMAKVLHEAFGIEKGLMTTFTPTPTTSASPTRSTKTPIARAPPP